MNETTSIRSRVMMVDPDYAKQLLLTNDLNRAMKRYNVDMIRRQMDDGTFNSLNGQTIVISKTGKLLDGQHRLTGIIESGKTYPFLIVEGVEEQAFTTIDLGVKRTGGDIFNIERIQYSNGIVAGLTAYLKLLNGYQGTGSIIYRDVSYNKMLQLYKQNPSLFDDLYLKAIEFNKRLKVLSASQIAGLLYYSVLHSNYKERAIEEFWTPLFNGASTAPQINQLYHKLVSELGNKGTQRAAPLKFKLAWIIMGYNNYFTDKTVKYLRYNNDTVFPTME